MLRLQSFKRKVGENLNMGAVGIGKLNVFNQCYFFEHILGLVAFVQAPVDNRESERSTMDKKNESGHRKKAVDGTGDPCKIGPAIVGLFKSERQKKIGLDKLVVDSLITLKEGKSIGRRLDFLARELEEEIDSLPFLDLSLLRLDPT